MCKETVQGVAHLLDLKTRMARLVASSISEDGFTVVNPSTSGSDDSYDSNAAWENLLGVDINEERVYNFKNMRLLPDTLLRFQQNGFTEWTSAQGGGILETTRTTWERIGIPIGEQEKLEHGLSAYKNGLEHFNAQYGMPGGSLADGLRLRIASEPAPHQASHVGAGLAQTASRQDPEIGAAPALATVGLPHPNAVMDDNNVLTPMVLFASIFAGRRAVRSSSSVSDTTRQQPSAPQREVTTGPIMSVSMVVSLVILVIFIVILLGHSSSSDPLKMPSAYGEKRGWVAFKVFCVMGSLFAAPTWLWFSKDLGILTGTGAGVAFASFVFTTAPMHCVGGDTRVLNSERKEVSIRDMMVGDYVLAWSKRKYVVCRILEKCVNIVPGAEVSEIVFGESKPVVATNNHPFWVDGKKWCSVEPQGPPAPMKTQQLSVGDVCRDVNGKVAQVKAIRSFGSGGKREVFNLVVDGAGSWFANGVLTHSGMQAKVGEENVRWNQK